MSDAHATKYQEMQKYVPFIQRVIDKLKVNNEHQADNPRKAQLQKMEMLHDLLTNKHKKIKIETLMKCEGVLIKLQAKIEKQTNLLQNEDLILNDVKLKQQTPCKQATSASKNDKVQEIDDILGPASPPPEVIPDNIDQPVVIPTERRCSPVLVEETVKASADNLLKKETLVHHRLQDSQHAPSKDFECLRKKIFHLNNNAGDQDEKKASHHQRSHHDSGTSGHKEHHHTKETQHPKQVNPSRQNSIPPKEKDVEAIKSPALGQMLQTVKVVITEPLPAHIKKQHFPSSSIYLPGSSICHNNLKTLRQASQTKDDFNEAYSPEELWEKFNDSHSKRPSARTTSTAPVFSRLGAKVTEDSSASCSATRPAGRYTPIPDVLKSPPLSVSDINNLLLESGADKVMNDISEIGSRRPVKKEDEKESPNNSFEFVRKKLAQSTRINSSHSESPKVQTDKDTHRISPLLHERIALKYNPHPRQERLQSISSTDGSECSTQSKINDPRIKLKLQTASSLHSPTQVSVSNVNVLPAINLSDPRLKKQNVVPTPSEIKSLPSTPTPNMSFLNQNTNTCDNHKDPRVPRIPSNTSPIRTTPTRKLSINQPQYSSEENWDSDEEELTWPPIKSDPRLSKKEQKSVESRYENSGEPNVSFERNYSDIRNATPNGRNSANQQDTFPLIGIEKEASIEQPTSQNNVNPKQVLQKEQNFNKQKDTATGSNKSKNKLKPATTFVIPNPPKSDTEEDWDTEDETTNATPKVLTADAPKLSINKSPLAPIITPYHKQISPKAFVNPIHISTTAVPLVHVPPVHVTPILHPLSQYPLVGLNSHHHNLLMQNTASNNRFNSVLNDKSERVKYFEAKKQKTIEPRTYKEFREAKERAQAQEAAMKRAADEAEAKRKAQEFKEVRKDKEIRENICDKKQQQMNASKKIDEVKKEKKVHSKDNKKHPPIESTLDKMYRTQNFNSKFPKANTSFKIPKKRTEEKTKVEAAKSIEATSEKTGHLSNEKAVDKIKPNQAEPITDKTKSLSQGRNDIGNNKKISNDIKVNQTEHFDYKNLETNEKAPKIQEQPQNFNDNSSKKAYTHKEKPTNDKAKVKFDNSNISENISAKTSSKQTEKASDEKQKESADKSEELLSENNMHKSAEDDNKINVRDPRCRPKPTSVTEDFKEKEPHNENFKMFGDLVITSAENQVILKPQQNLDKFNKLTQDLLPKPQRVLRRRNTMVVFDSAPLVDKEKLKKTNALLFEDVQEEEKRKRKQAEDDRLIARRNKNLEEMFKKTDDNCTVSTQNIITGKRRTRATINFNETVNAINVFKHTTMKDSSLGTVNITPPAAQAIKTTRSNFKIKLKNFDVSDTKDDESGDDENLGTLARKEAKAKETKGVKTKSKETKLREEIKNEQPDTEAIAKLAKTRSQTSTRSSISNALEDTQSATVNIEAKFKPIQNDENQNCAVSSTSTDNYTVEDTASSSTSGKTESDDNEPTSTASKSNNQTATAEQHVLNEIVDQILKPNTDREHILGLLGQILNEEKLELIKSLMESSNRQNEDQPIRNETAEETNNKEIHVAKIKTSTKNKDRNIKLDDYEEEEQEDRKTLKSTKGDGGKKMTMPKKKRSELDRLNEDIRDMFICEGVLTATGRRMCTIMGKDVDSVGGRKWIKESTLSPMSEQENRNTRKETLKPPVVTRPLRRSIRCCKTNDDNEDDEVQSTTSRTTEESFDEFNTTDNSNVTDATPQRKMPVLKPHTPIKIPEEVSPNVPKAKELVNKRKSDSKIGNKAKKNKNNKDDHKEDLESEEKDSETEAEADEVVARNNKKDIKNTNVHWHNQSKYTTWCIICEKRIPSNLSSLHYKTHHRENYISRMAPVLLQQFKQGKLNQPLFGVKKAQKQPSWFYRCPFCLKYFNTAMPLWLEHFQNHTVEFRYECSNCHRCSNRKITVSRHIKNCEGATIISSAVKLNVPTVINAHVCHLCNFIQLKRVNLERHYIEQHQLQKKTVDLLGYVIKLFDVENVECVTEENAVEREKQAWKSIEENEQVIDIDDDDDDDVEKLCTVPAAECKEEEKENETKTVSSESTNQDKQTSTEKEKNQNVKSNMDLQRSKEVAATEIGADAQQTKNIDKVSTLGNQQRQHEKTQEDTINAATSEKRNMKPVITIKQAHTEDQVGKTQPKLNKTTKLESDNESRQEIIKMATSEQEKIIKIKKAKQKKTKSIVTFDLTESESNDYVAIEGKKSVEDLQDELLALAAAAAGKEDDNQISKEKDCENETVEVTNQEIADETPKTITNNHLISEPQTTMSDIISSSIDMIYNRDCSSTDNKRKSTGTDPSESKKVCLTASNVFMPTRDEYDYSPTTQILAQSIINIEEQGNNSVRDKPITMAERLSQRFKELQNEDISSGKANIDQATSKSTNKCSKENAFEKLINDTLLELTKVKDGATNRPASERASKTPITEQPKENVFDKLFSETVLELENDKDNESVNQIMQQTEIENISKDVGTRDVITVISDDEDWEDIEITETAPTTSTSTVNIQKSKNKGLFQKFSIFKGNNTKSKKHLPPLVYLPKKKKEKSLQSTTLSSSPISTITTAATTKVNEITTNNSISNCNAHLSFKPVNIMDGLFPDSPCNDPIDLVPELAPLEPLQDLNDISSILDSNLSAVNINAADNHTSIEDALDFISEQQANDKEKSNSLAFKSIMPSQAKTTINNISHVGFSVQTAEENSFKFYCLLQNCSFLYSSDAIGLENHFMCEHSEIKWNGYCLMCQSQCFPNADAGEEHSISKEIRHMMEQHAYKSVLDLNTDSTQHSTTSSHDNDERPKIKIRRLTGDCLSRATPENIVSSNEVPNSTTTNVTPPISMLGALLVAEPKPPTKKMPPQLQLPLTEPLLLDNNTEVSPQLPFRNVNSDFRITSVTSSAPNPNQAPLQISSVVSLNKTTSPTTNIGPIQIPKISNVRTLVPKAGSLWSQQIEKDRLELVEAAEESLEVSRILENARRLSTNREVSRSVNDSPVVVAETMPLAQSKTGDFVVTQTVSAQYSEFSSTSLGFNISIAASTTSDKTETTPVTSTSTTTSTSIASRQYKCMGTGCKFVSRVPVAMSDHLRFHERRNFSNKRDYLSCGFCFYCASDVEDYMKHANQFHIIGKGGAAPFASSETDTATSLTQKIQNILNSSNSSNGHSRYSAQSQQKKQTTPVQDTQEVYLKKLRETIDEIVGPTGLADDKLYRCVIKNCYSQLTESTFLSHIMFHITTNGGNPNNYIFKCPHCTAQYHRPAGIKAHIKNHARNRYFCYLCDETSTNPGQLLRHFSDKHWHTLNMYTKELLKPKTSTDGSEMVLDSSYYVAYTQDLSAEEVRRFGEKLILEWQRKKSGSKTHFKSTEIDLLPLSAIFQREVNCGECEYKTKVRTNMFRHLLMHKQNPDMTNKSGLSNVCSVDPVNPVPCLNSTERFFDKMTNLASSSLTPSNTAGSSTSKPSFKIPYRFVEETKRYTCGCQGCNYCTISEDLFRTHLSTLHSTAMAYCCTFCQEEICKRGITLDRIMNHTRFHGATIYHCEECNYVHHLRYVVERHINEKHATMKVNIITHNRTSEDSTEGTTTAMPFAGKKYKETVELNQTGQNANTCTRSTNSESSGTKPIPAYANSAKGKGKWVCDVCGHRTSTVSQIQTHCQQQHGVKNQYKCAHCNFGSQQLSQILHHIDEKHSGKTREARYMYHKTVISGEEVSDTRPLWQRNDPTRIRHIRGILMEDEEESEEYRKKIALSEDVDDDSNGDKDVDVEENAEELNATNYITGYEFGCYHCSFKTQTFDDLKNQHYAQTHNCQLETAKPFWYRLQRRLCCPDCRSFLGNYNELQHHLQNTHKKSRFYAADIRMAENDDTSQRILCGYCSFHGANADHLYKHHLRVQHWPQDIRIDNNEQIMEILALGKAQVSYQCTLCADIFSNRVAIVQHACNSHAGEDHFSFRELTNSLIYRCNSCCFTSTTEKELLRHSLDHYSRFKICNFCREPQTLFNVYMQHCYAEHRNDIQRFRTIYPLTEIRKFLLQTLIVFPSGLVLNKRNLLNTKYGKTDVIEEVYEDIYKISQQPPIPRLSIARLVARKSIEAQQKHVDCSSSSYQDEILDAIQSGSKNISKRRLTVAFSTEDLNTNDNSLLKPKFNIVEAKTHANIAKRRTTVDHDQQQQQQKTSSEFNAPLQFNKISKRRRTVAVDRETLFSSNLMSSTDSLVTEKASGKKRKLSHAHTHSPKHFKESYTLNLDMEPFSFYGRTIEELDLTKIYTKVAIGGIKTPLTIDKFKLLFDIECQLKLTKCDDDVQLAYNDYKHIQKACPASHKSRFNESDK